MKKTLDNIIKTARANTAHAACFWDKQARLGVLIERDGTILAAMEYHIEKGMQARVQQSGSLQGRKGYGYCLYLYAKAALGPELMLSPDTTGLTRSALRLWERLFDADGICRRSLYYTQAYRPCMDEVYDEGVIMTNPSLLDEEWQAYEALGQLHERIASGDVKPHLANWGFTLPEPYQSEFAKKVRPINFTDLQKRVIYNYLTCVFQLEKTGYMIPMKLPKRAQTNLTE